MLASDGCAYVVKFQNNPQHLRVLANEFIGSRIAAEIGLQVPSFSVVDVSQWLVDSTPALTVDSANDKKPCKAGLQFGSLLVGGLMPGLTLDYLDETRLTCVRNLHEFAGMLLFDKWTSNDDGRQAVFHRQGREKHYTATFIDHGYCFNGGSWTFKDGPLRGTYRRHIVYQDVKGWESFEPWLTRLDQLDGQTLWDIGKEVPEEWIGGIPYDLEQLVERLLARRARIRELVLDFRESAYEPFPKWKAFSRTTVASASGRMLILAPRMEGFGGYG